MVKKMNERIEHCLYQAGLTAQGCWEELDDYAKEGIEKFAELIVKECLNICEDMGDNGKDGHYCADKIAKTFRS
jgi:hypothetical protein